MLWFLSPGEVWDAVGLNGEKSATTENQCARCQVCGLRGVY